MSIGGGIGVERTQQCHQLELSDRLPLSQLLRKRPEVFFQHALLDSPLSAHTEVMVSAHTGVGERL